MPYPQPLDSQLSSSDQYYRKQKESIIDSATGDPAV